jgi:integrase
MEAPEDEVHIMSGMHAIELRDTTQILNRLSTKYACLAAIGVTTGCRISEVLSLKRGDLIDCDGNIKSRIKFVKLKTGQEDSSRQMIIPSAVHKYITRHLQAEAEQGYELSSDWVFRGHGKQPLKRQAAYNAFRRVLGNGYGTHWMRKTFAQELYKYFLEQNPNDSLRALDLTRQALGHSKIETTIKYLGIEYDQIDTAQNNIFSKERLHR